MPGGITRLLACSDDQMKSYKGLHIGPTLVHMNHGHIAQTRDPDEKSPYGSVRTDRSPSYNKPGSIMHWVNEAPEAKTVEFVLYIDADMLLRLVSPSSLSVWLANAPLDVKRRGKL